MMLLNLLIYFSLVTSICSRHFNGGTLSWAPVDPYDNSTPVVITITQTYFWTYPYVTCATNVPISTSRFAGVNTTLICVVDCSTDGGYSNKTIKTITDCISASSTMGIMTSERSTNVTLGSDAHFYLANTGTAWTPLNSPAQSGLEWSIITSIDIRPRPDGFINSSPVVKMISPQYVFANKTTEIRIPVSDANVGDDVRCRWSTYTPGYRRRKRFHSDAEKVSSSQMYFTQVKPDVLDLSPTRNRRGQCGGGAGGGAAVCNNFCGNGCQCTCAACDLTICNGSTCVLTAGCLSPTLTTTLETTATLRSTSSYVHRQAIDECGDICHDVSLPNGTTLSNCTIQIKPTKTGVWYGVAVQVEDFINTTSTTPMSSVPIQFLIYVLPTPTCSLVPIILPLNRCLEVQVGVSITFNISVINQCNQTVVQIADLIVTSTISGMTQGNLTTASSNSSISYVQFAWTPQSNQIGFQQLCMTAYTDEMVQSDLYCITFTVKNSSDTCTTTTTISFTSTSTSSSSSIVGSSVATGSFTSTTTKRVFSASSSNLLPVALGLGLSLSLLLCCTTCLLCLFLCCRFGSGALWRDLRRVYWKEKYARCETCQIQFESHAFEKASTVNETSVKNYRKEYITDGKNAHRENSFYSHIRQPNRVSPSDLPLPVTRRSTFRSTSSVRVAPTDTIHKDCLPNECLSSSKFSGSLLMQKYMKQNEQRENSFYRYLRQSNKVSPSDLPFPVTRRSTFLSTSSGRVVPNDIMHKDDLPNERLSSSKFSGSLLMQKYMKQNEHEHKLFN